MTTRHKGLESRPVTGLDEVRVMVQLAAARMARGAERQAVAPGYGRLVPPFQLTYFGGDSPVSHIDARVGGLLRRSYRRLQHSTQRLVAQLAILSFGARPHLPLVVGPTAADALRSATGSLNRYRAIRPVMRSLLLVIGASITLLA